MEDIDYEKLFCSRWEWQSENVFKDIEDWPDHYILNSNSCNIPCIINDLFEKGENDKCCTHCPVIWGTENKGADSFCLKEGSLYLQWHKTKFNSKRNSVFDQGMLSYIASAISELPWKYKQSEIQRLLT